MQIRQSELSQWRGCRRKTALQYWRGYKGKRHESLSPPSKARIGTLVHLALEHYYRDGSDPAAMVLAESKRIASEWGLAGYTMDEEWRDGMNLAYIMAKGYVDWVEETGADAGLTITGVEREIIVPWGNVYGVDVEIVGHIDLEGIDALGRPVLLDHKSVAAISAPEGPADFQRLTYAVLRKLEDGTSYAEMIHNQLKRVKRTARAKPPFFARWPITINEEQMRKHYQVMNVRIEEIVNHRLSLDSGIIDLGSPMLDASPNKDCSWSCPYYHLCPMMDDGSDWEWYLSENYEIGQAHVPGQEEAE